MNAYGVHTRWMRVGLLFAMTLLMSQGACSVRFNWPRHRIDVRVVTHSAPSSLWANLDSVELMPCDEAPRGYAARLLPEAHAHGVSTDTIIAVHHVLNMRADGAAIGAWTPPPGDYCFIEALFAPADDDALGLAKHPEMKGHSVIFNNQMTTRKLAVRLKLPTPITLSEDDDSQRALTLKISTQPADQPSSDWVGSLQESLSLEVAP